MLKWKSWLYSKKKCERERERERERFFIIMSWERERERERVDASNKVLGMYDCYDGVTYLFIFYFYFLWEKVSPTLVEWQIKCKLIVVPHSSKLLDLQNKND